LDERQMLGSPPRRLDDRPSDGRGQNQQQDFRQWIQNLGMLAGIGQQGEVIQQRRADRGCHVEASIDVDLNEPNLHSRRKRSPPCKRLAWASPEIGLRFLSKNV
jgi:hypothetical protein